MSKNIHSNEMHRLADAPSKTKVYYKDTSEWKLTSNPSWVEAWVYIVADEWAEIRKAMVDGKTIEFTVSVDILKWSTIDCSVDGIGTEECSLLLSNFRIKPDVVEPVYYYQYEKLFGDSIQITRHINYLAVAQDNLTEDRGWFKIESSKREWEH